MSSISWNPNLKLILSDVDETVADLYLPAVPAMILELTKLLEDDISIFFVTGQGLKSVQWRIVEQLPAKLRHKILIGHCSGAEVWGYTQSGQIQDKPYYSLYEDHMTNNQKNKWREIVKQLIKEFTLKIFPTMPVKEFLDKTKNHPLAIMYEDRGPQITFEVINGHDLKPEQINALNFKIPQIHGTYDLRTLILERAHQLFNQANLPIEAKLAGVFAIDFVVKGVSKTTAVKFVLDSNQVLKSIGLTESDLDQPKHLEIWGDKFSPIRGGSDRYMSQAVSKQVRSIDFRKEDPNEFEPGYNIVLWDGQRQLHEGLLEFLQSRHK